MDLKSKLSEDELDLSMSDLKDVPVSKIAKLSKVKKLDLSNNSLVYLPTNFTTSLSHLVKLDLSSNKLVALPHNIDLIVNLDHLDLFNNLITDLPLSLGNLNSLKYIDVSNNPLQEHLTTVAGGCQNIKECLQAARNLRRYLRKISEEKEREFTFKIVQKTEPEMKAENKRDKNRVDGKIKERNGTARKESVAYDSIWPDKIENKSSKNRKGSSSSAKHNGNVTDTTKNDNSSRPIKSNRSKNKSANKSSGIGYSFWGFINVMLLISVLFVGSLCSYLYMDGDLSVKGAQTALSRFKTNIGYLSNFLTNRVFNYDNLNASVEFCVRVSTPIFLRICEFASIIGAFVIDLAVVVSQVVTQGSVVMYSNLPSWDTVLSVFFDILSYIQGLLESIDWKTISKYCIRLKKFVIKNYNTLEKGFWRNGIVLSIWDFTEPLRNGLFQLTFYCLDRTLVVVEWMCENVIPVFKFECQDFVDEFRAEIRKATRT